MPKVKHNLSLYGVNSSPETLFEYSIKYINDILSQIRKGKIDYMHDMKKILLLSAYEPEVKIVDFYDGCYYVTKDIKK